MMSKPGIISKNSPTQIGYGESDIIEVAINGFEYFTDYKLLIDEKSLGIHSFNILASKISFFVKANKQEKG